MDVVLWLSVALKAVQEDGNQIPIADELAVTDPSVYRWVWALYFWNSSPKAKNVKAGVAISCLRVMPGTPVVICRRGYIQGGCSDGEGCWKCRGRRSRTSVAELSANG